MKLWFRYQNYALFSAFAYIKQAPGNFIINVFVIAVTLILPFGALTLVKNVNPLISRLHVEGEMSVFLKLDTPRAEALKIDRSIRGIFSDHKVNIELIFIPKEAALENMKTHAGMADAIETLGTNPLPDAYLIKMDSKNENFPDAANAFVSQLSQLPNVDRVQVDFAWFSKLNAIWRIIDLVILCLSVALSVVVIMVSFNTIRLQVMARLEEISQLQLIGATDAFIRNPFRYSGMMLGFFAGILSLIIIALLLIPLNSALSDLARAYSANLAFSPLGVLESAFLLAISAFLGWLGAALSVWRNLARLNN